LQLFPVFQQEKARGFQALKYLEHSPILLGLFLLNLALDLLSKLHLFLHLMALMVAIFVIMQVLRFYFRVGSA